MDNDTDIDPNELPWQAAFAQLDITLELFRELSNDDRYRSRPLSIAITNLETGELWANTAFGGWVDHRYETEEKAK